LRLRKFVWYLKQLDWTENIRESIQSIKGNRLRTILTALIISIGIMALVGILTSIDGIKLSLYNNFSLLGANSFKIQNRGLNARFGSAGAKAKQFPALRFREVLEFKSRFHAPALISISTTVSGASTVKGNKLKTNPNIRIVGGDENFGVTNGYKFAAGRNITQGEALQGSNVTVIGDEVRKKLFSDSDPIGKLISIGSEKFQVVGLFAPKGSSAGPRSDGFCLIPLLKGKALNTTGSPSFSVVVQVQDAVHMDPLVSESTSVFRNIRQLRLRQENNFEITKSDELINQFLGNVQYVTIAATAIGVITLLGASIALMNIMLVSVTERTREIGIRKAIGATSDEIRRQFLIEALVICQLGGIGGIFLGIVIGNGVSSLIGGGFLIPWLWMAGGIVLCVIVGIASGLYPAIKASHLDPVEALRYE